MFDRHKKQSSSKKQSWGNAYPGFAKEHRTVMNATLRLPKEQLDALAPAEVEAYLRARGWEADPALASSEVGVYHHSGDPDGEVLVPRATRA